MKPAICQIDGKNLKKICKNHYKCSDGHIFRHTIDGPLIPVLIKLDKNGIDTEEKYTITKDNEN